MAIISMTGFGRGQLRKGDIDLVVEIKSVNSRFLDLVWRLPPPYAQCEIEFASLLKKYVRRGRLEIFVSRKERQRKESILAFNERAFRLYVNAAKQAMKSGGITGKPAMEVILPLALQQREVLELITQENDIRAELSSVKGVFVAAVRDLMNMRKKEGKLLEKEVRALLRAFVGCERKLRKAVKFNAKLVQNRLQERLDRLGLGRDSDPQRLAQEIAIFADRSDVTEELARLQSHVDQFMKIITQQDNGRKLEFLLQEMGREVNTIGSKSQSAEASQLVVEAKSLLEKIREQVLNFE